MRVARWTLLAAALAASVYAKKEPSSAAKDSKSECMAPSAVASFESKIGDLQETNAALQLQINAQSAEKTKLLADVAKEHETIVLNLQKEIASLTTDVESLEKGVTTLEKDVADEKKAVEKAEQELKTAQDKLNEETKRVASRDSDVTKLEADLTKADAELKAALSKLAEETKRSSQLEKNHQNAEKRNKSLLKELSEAKSVELSMASLLSSYYDDALVLAEQSVVYAQEKLSEQSEALEQVQSKLNAAKKSACETSSKFYQDNLAATLDPIFVDVHKTVDPIWADVHKAVHPHVNKYLPIVQDGLEKAKGDAVQYSQEALRRAKLARLEAITLLEQNEHVATHAQKVIDGVLIVLAVPLVLFQIRLALLLVWWLFTTMLCVLTCGLCCGARKRSSKTKRKIVKKTASVNSTLNAPLNGPATSTTKKTAGSKTTSTTQKRSKKAKN